MKIFVVGFAVAILVVASLVLFKKSPSDAHQEWKRYAVETETAVRPARFNEMKFDPARDAVEMRSPASKRK